MKFKYNGPRDEVTVRHVTFAKGEAVDLDLSDPRDEELAAKLSNLEQFAQVKAGRPKKKEND